MKRSVTALAVFLLGTLAACDRLPGDGGPRPQQEAPQQEAPQQEAPQQQTPQQQTTKPKRFSWGLPLGDVSPNDNEQRVYRVLRTGDCAKAQRTLDQPASVGLEWQGFASPRNVLLAQAAIGFCADDTTTGTEMFNRAKRLGWAGLLPGDGEDHAACEYRKSAGSLIEQRPRSEIACPVGEPPQWKQETQEDRVDPRK